MKNQNFDPLQTKSVLDLKAKKAKITQKYSDLEGKIEQLESIQDDISERLEVARGRVVLGEISEAKELEQKHRNAVSELSAAQTDLRSMTTALQELDRRIEAEIENQGSMIREKAEKKRKKQAGELFETLKKLEAQNSELRELEKNARISPTLSYDPRKTLIGFGHGFNPHKIHEWHRRLEKYLAGG